MVWRYGDEESRTVAYRRPSEKRQRKHYHVTFEPLFDDPGTVDLSGINWIVVGTMTGAQSRKIHTEPEWAWSLADQAHKLGIPVFMKEDLVPIIGIDRVTAYRQTRLSHDVLCFHLTNKDSIHYFFHPERSLTSSLPKYISNFPYFTGFPACALEKRYVFSLIFALMR